MLDKTKQPPLQRRTPLRPGGRLRAKAKPKPKKFTLSKAKERAWDAFSKYIRLKYSNAGWCNCVTCGKNMWWKEAQAGHGIPGRTNGILLLEEIVRPQCVACNRFRGGMPDIFIPYLIDMYGREGYDEFLRMKHEPKKFYVDELLQWAAEWEAEVNRMLEII